ncbi:MAG TPA: DUF1592 domain-containing protein [Pirellulaceae bacterium]|nr:DUF1592 domain-containing protein [Pirellulaceae bacterium]
MTLLSSIRGAFAAGSPTAACWLVLALFAHSAFAADTSPSPEISAAAREFVANRCLDCHSAASPEGGLDLESLSATLADAETVRKWSAAFDRVSAGEMPPETEERPQPQEVDGFLSALAPALTAGDRTHREVVQRRLNRVEYEYAIRDLLGLAIDLKDRLPADQQGGGFDNDGAALAVSPELMQLQYELAREAIDAALVTGPRPETKTVVADSYDEVMQYVPKTFGRVDDRLVVYMNNATAYSKLSTRSKRLPVAGRYRFSFTAATHRSEKPIVFSVVASNFAGVGARSVPLGWYEATAEPKRFDIEADLDENFAIQFFGHGLSGWIKDVSVGDHPGLGFSPVEITGPLYDAWPPESHRRLVGDVDLAKGTPADAENVFASFLPRAFRRPVQNAEVARYVALVESRMAAGRSFDESLRAALAAALCSPNFLYLHEEQREPGQTIGDYELASRLSFFLWRSMPDDELFDLAANNRLHEPDVLAQQVERMLMDAKSERLVQDFVSQWLKLREIDATTPDMKLYPEFDELLKISMVGESEAFFRLLLQEDRSVANLLDSDFAMLNGRLAKHYGIDDVEGLEIREVKLPPESVRGGVLTQGAVLKVTANGTTTSPVTRGAWVLENLLGKEIPPPPPSVPGLEPDIRGASTIREQLDKHRDDASCNVCHRHIDPPGFALESFDPAGKHREKYLRFVVNPDHVEEGWGSVQPVADVDASGTMTTGQSFEDIRQFKQLLVADKARFVRCLTEKLTTYGLGRELGFSDREAIERLARQTEKQGDGLRTLVKAIVLSETFQMR